MKRMEDFSKVIGVVSELTEVTQQDILGKSKVPEVVDARWIVVCLMAEKGYTARQIATVMLCSARTINHILASVDKRIKYSCRGLRNTLAIARQQLQ